MQVNQHNSISEIPENLWNELHQSSNPFIQHQFLKALEDNGCVGEKYGWHVKHLTFSINEEVIAALPLFAKDNNYGEFVFDHQFERAWNSVGLPYYPKLVTAAPYTPVQGPRLLVKESFRNNASVLTELFKNIEQYCADNDFSGWHLLFSDAKPTPAENYLQRTDVQFHWFNQNYANFDEYLAALKPKKRKNIKQERKALQQTGIEFRILDGHTATEHDWETFDYFYQKTFVEKWSTPTLNQGFFKQIARTLPDSIVLVLADSDNETIAGALMFRSENALFGRHWGCAKEVKHLHFETCFYQGIEYAIKHGLNRFEPGAGGEHKIARGFIPVIIHSYHYFPVNPFVEGLKQFEAEENRVVLEYADEIWSSSPYQENELLRKLSNRLAN